MDKGREKGRHSVDRGRCGHAAINARGARKVSEGPRLASASQLASLYGGDIGPAAS